MVASCNNRRLKRWEKHRIRYYYILILLLIFTLYPADSKVGKGDIPFPLSQFRSSLSAEGMAFWRHSLLSGENQCRVNIFIASLPERENKIIKYFIFPSGYRTHNLSRLQLHACAPMPRLASKYLFWCKVTTLVLWGNCKDSI